MSKMWRGYTTRRKFSRMTLLKYELIHKVKHSIVYDIKYWIKNYFSILSGYSHLATRSKSPEYQYFSKIKDYEDNPFYVCAEFKNKRHIPLPLLLMGINKSKDNPKGFQRLVVSWGIKSNRLNAAIEDCVKYTDGYNKLKKKYHRGI